MSGCSAFGDFNDYGSHQPVKVVNEQIKQVVEENTLYSPSPFSFAKDIETGEYYVNNIVIIFLKNGTTSEQVDSLVSSIDGKIVGELPIINQIQVQVSTRTLDKLKALCKELEKNEIVDDAMYDPAAEMETSSLPVPNDPWLTDGYAVNAIDGSGIPNAAISVRGGWNNTSHGNVIYTAVTDQNGHYSVKLPVGNYTLVVCEDAFTSASMNIAIQSGRTTTQNITLSPVMSDDILRVVLVWGEHPRDIDSHLWGPHSSDGYYHVYYVEKDAYDYSAEKDLSTLPLVWTDKRGLVCNLDIDDTESYGPETVTFVVNYDEPYYYFVHKYAENGSLSSSEAKVMLYQATICLQHTVYRKALAMAIIGMYSP